ncbi:stage III sporulation protein AG [Blautia sp. An81]|uniref:stage III sporulation protein AG n=1 Tax=Blautia sp. An81 TaxID=1965659 RepID=UPI000B366984|nr:stage III sporulation protein AG [Blautia sp. An81]OUN31880.1 stage III sporulation protein AG [Blautia sp. An81]
MKPLEKWMKKENLGVLLLVGLLLLVIALPTRQENENTITEENTQETDQSLQEQDWQTKMEERLVEVLEQVQGVGKAEVFLTCEGTQEKVVEKDETETVYERDSRGNQTPYVSAEIYPQVTGVLVVAQGGDDPVVIQNIQEAVQVLFQVEAHKIKVMKMN